MTDGILADVARFLERANRDDWRARDSRPIRERLGATKALAVERGDEDLATVCWAYETSTSMQDHFIAAFAGMKAGRYYEAWCSLDRAELDHGFLVRHLARLPTEVHASSTSRLIARYQALYPYKIFMSAEIRERAKRCSTCGAQVSIRSPCGHRVGEIYGGEMCFRIVEGVEFLGTAFVENPVEKSAVPFVVDPETGDTVDQYDYGVVEYAIQHLDHPYEPWSVEDTTRLYDHGLFRHVGRNDRCPCGSTRKYKKCCLRRDGVELPHKQFTFPRLQVGSSVLVDEVELRLPAGGD